MNTEQYLLTQLGEEAAEVIQMCSKCVRFGVDEVYDSVTENPARLTNRERLIGELRDMKALINMLQGHGVLPVSMLATNENGQIAAKCAKVEKYAAYSRELGILND